MPDGTNDLMLTVGEIRGSLGKATSAPAAVAHVDGSMDLLVRGYDQALWHRHYDGSTWSFMDSGVLSTLFDVWGSSGSDVFVAADEGVILHYDGSVWSTMASGTSEPLRVVSGSGSSDVCWPEQLLLEQETLILKE